MPAPSPTKRNVSNIKSSILRPALTSHYQCWFNPPDTVRKWIKDKRNAGIGDYYDADLLSISCSEASLPGSSIATHEINNDFTGVTERHGYRRLYDDRADFTFYVDHDHNIITFFENWIAYIVNEQYTNTENKPVESLAYSYRVNYPKNYRSDAIYIDKFERDYSSKFLRYRFLQAYPISINSMPVSYDSSQLLKCTVSFTYTRYLLKDEPNTEQNTQTAQTKDGSEVSPSSNPVTTGGISQQTANSKGRMVEAGLPYVGRNVGPIAPFSGI